MSPNNNVTSATLEDNSFTYDKQSLFPHTYDFVVSFVKKYFDVIDHTGDADLSLTAGEVTPESYVESLFLNFTLVSNANEVVSFLRDNSFLLPIVQETVDKVEEYFEDVKEDLLLRLFEDPETGDREIILVVMVNTSPDDALKRFEALRQDWWLKVFGKTQWKMSIDIDFV